MVSLARAPTLRPSSTCAWPIHTNVCSSKCRSRDGTTLYACSSEGHIAVMQFTFPELGNVAPAEWTAKIRTKWDFHKPARHAVHAHAGGAGGTANQPNVLMARKGPRKEASSSALLPIPPPFAPQNITINKDGKRRIQPTFLGLGGIVAQPATTTLSAAASQQPQSQQARYQPPVAGPSHSLGGQYGQHQQAGPSRAQGGVFQPAFAQHGNGYDVLMADNDMQQARTRVSKRDCFERQPAVLTLLQRFDRTLDRGPDLSARHWPPILGNTSGACNPRGHGSCVTQASCRRIG